MTDLRCPAAYVDFVSVEPLEAVAKRLSESLFGGIPFVGAGEGLWDEVPAVRLARDFLGLRVELGGEPGPEGGYTLQIEAIAFPWDRIPPENEAETNADLSGFVGYLLGRIETLQPR